MHCVSNVSLADCGLSFEGLPSMTAPLTFHTDDNLADVLRAIKVWHQPQQGQGFLDRSELSERAAAESAITNLYALAYFFRIRRVEV